MTAKIAFKCKHCGAGWWKPPKRDRRAPVRKSFANGGPINKRRFGRANRRRVVAYKCCPAQAGVAR